MAHMSVGMIGLGLMGGPMAQRLVGEGFKVTGCDVVLERTLEAQSGGVGTAKTPADLAAAADIILICVATSKDVADVIEGADGILQATNRRCQVVVDVSTTELGVTKRLADLLDTAQVAFVDAPVSGGPAAAAAGTLAIMAGGAVPAIDRVRPIMSRLGTFTHMGPTGAGQATKLVNQILVLNNFVVMAEALRMAEAYGVDAAKVPEALARGHAGSNLLPVMFSRMIARDWTPTGFARQVLKDLEMVSAAAKTEGLATPMTGQALTLYRMLVGDGRGDVDGAAVLELLPEAESRRQK